MSDVYAPVRRKPRVPWWSLIAVLTAILTLCAPSLAAPPTNGVGLATRQLELIGQQPIVVSDKVAPSLAQIDTKTNYAGVIGTGAGIVIDPSGTVVTNNHVIAGADVITATVAGRSFPAKLLGYDRGSDIAVIQLQGADGLPPAPIGDSNLVTIGEPVLSMGNADGTGAPPTRQPGNVTGLNRNIEAVDELTGTVEQLTGLIESSAGIRPGDSGGALVNSAAQVIAVNVAANANYRLSGGQGFSIPINQAMGIANQIRAGAASDVIHIGPPAQLGVGVNTGPNAPGAPPGVPVRDVIAGKPADQAGLAPGDMITAINGIPIDSPTRLTQVLDNFYPGNVVDLAFIDRAGVPRSTKVTLIAGPSG